MGGEAWRGVSPSALQVSEWAAEPVSFPGRGPQGRRLSQQYEIILFPCIGSQDILSQGPSASMMGP